MPHTLHRLLVYRHILPLISDRRRRVAAPLLVFRQFDVTHCSVAAFSFIRHSTCHFRQVRHLRA
jgi:hypothetical protein